MDDLKSQSLNADQTTQKLSATSSLEKHEYKLQHTDYSAISKVPIVNQTWEQRGESIEICLNKLDALKRQDLKQEEIDTCFQKLNGVYRSFYQS